MDEYAPLYHLKADLPPIFMLVGENDIPGRKYENLLMLDTLKALGHKDCSIYIATGATHNEKLVLKEPVQKFIHHIID